MAGRQGGNKTPEAYIVTSATTTCLLVLQLFYSELMKLDYAALQPVSVLPSREAERF